MDEAPDEKAPEAAVPLPGLSDEEVSEVAERRAGSPKVLHEVVRLQGNEELGRPVTALLCSGFAAGVSICASLLAEAFLTARLPDSPWTPLVAGFGYTVGFVITIMGNLQLFTESTITVVLPLATHPTARNVGRLIRLWVVVLAANLAGTLLVAYAVSRSWIVSEEMMRAVIALSRAQLDLDPLTVMMRGMPAGFLVASIAWILPNGRGSEIWLIVFITYVIALGGFTHVVAGSAEAWCLWITGHITLWHGTMGYMLPALVGNIIGGTGLFAVLAHGQVREEITAEHPAPRPRR